jgi:replicative DNA helicase
MNAMMFHDDRSESFVVGACLYQPELLDDAMPRIPDGEAFINPTLHSVYDVMCHVYTKTNGKLDTALLLSEAGRRGMNLTVEDLLRLIESRCTDIVLPYHIDRVAYCYRVRRTLAAITDANWSIDRDPENIDHVVGELLDRLTSESGIVESKVHEAAVVAAEIHAKIMRNEKDDFVPTGYKTLDQWLRGGIRPGEIMVVGGRPGQGKTALGVNIGIRAASLGYPVAMLSIEMSETEIARRMRAYYGCPMNATQQDEMVSEQANERLNGLPFKIVDLSSGRLSDIQSHVRTLARRDGVRMFVLDYLQLVKAGKNGGEEYQRITLASQAMKQMAREYGVAMLVLAQVNREGGKREKPTMNDLKGSGSIEQDADQILLIHNPQGCDAPELILAKHRNGRTGRIAVTYAAVHTRFEDQGEAREGYGEAATTHPI